MKQTRCKFKCDSVTLREGANDVEMSPVVNGSEENKTFWKYTPGGKFTMSWINPNIQFTPGKEYYFDITPAE
jgi:hypothetical protein